MTNVFDFDGGVDPAAYRDLICASVGAVNYGSEVRHRLQSVVEPQDVEGFGAVQALALRVHRVGELKRNYSHAAKIATVDALKALSDDSFDPEQPSSFGCPIPRAARAVLLACDDDQ